MRREAREKKQKLTNFSDSQTLLKIRQQKIYLREFQV